MHGQRTQGLALGLLLAQILQVCVDRIPPVTLASIGAQVALFLGIVRLPYGGISDICVSALHVWYRADWKRLIVAAFYHMDEWHLYYNMVSMLWKGMNLERKLGSAYFAYMIAVFTVATNALLVALSIGAENIFHDHSYISTCAVGFSGRPNSDSVHKH
jgi:rhomboid domain-containing protein 1